MDHAGLSMNAARLDSTFVCEKGWIATLARDESAKCRSSERRRRGPVASPLRSATPACRRQGCASAALLRVEAAAASDRSTRAGHARLFFYGAALFLSWRGAGRCAFAWASLRFPVWPGAAGIGGIGAQGSIAIPRSTTAVAKRRSARDASRRRCCLSGPQAVNNTTAAQATTVVRRAEPGCLDMWCACTFACAFRARLKRTK